MNLNKVILIGRLTKDPELRQLSSGHESVYFTLAISRQFAPPGQERQSDFIQCVAWGPQAKFLGNFMRKGSLLSVEGRIQTRTYETETGTRYITEVVAESIQSLEPKSVNETPNRSSNVSKADPFSNVDENQAFYESSKNLTSDDDLPF